MHEHSFRSGAGRLLAGVAGRRLVLGAACAVLLLGALPSRVIGIGQTDALAAVRGALEKGADAAVAQLGAHGGFANDPQWRIPLPGALRKSEKLLRFAGQGDALDSLEATMNDAAERAVSRAKPLLYSAIRDMSVADAQRILTGGDDSVTGYFREKTESALGEEFRPVVSSQLQSLGVAQQYDAIAGRGAKFGLVDADAASLDGYVTGRAIDAVYALIAEKERAIRADPVSTGSELLKRVFGSIR